MDKIISSTILYGTGQEYLEPAINSIKQHMEYTHAGLEYKITDPYPFEDNKFRIDAIEVDNG